MQGVEVRCRSKHERLWISVRDFVTPLQVVRYQTTL